MESSAVHWRGLRYRVCRVPLGAGQWTGRETAPAPRRRDRRAGAVQPVAAGEAARG